MIIGTKWDDETGREWEVYNILAFGKAVVRTTDMNRVGEMRLVDVRKEVANSTARRRG